ncbi:BspA family leucine-rich repeat surface protein [Prevotella sp. TCVGH]|uniref:BspA family leucine-rich repeat surface protein n=1 Tax=Prevotella sp. TCVGH TaxID=2182433 RepID=UPI00201E2DAB|nr:BspA family leucine-rich repeat surface protein [Prevotella sp. TCVGH]MCL6749096.1 BspA family leucine-rich repeat surface protein [Prevotella sp. TCVGH]
MRNYLLSLLVGLLTVTGSLSVAAQEAYAVLTPDGTLTFFFDNQRTTHQDHNRIYDMPEPEEGPAWAGYDSNPQRNIKHVVFDDSFSEYRPTSTNSWFAFCINLQDIEGIRNLNTENVTNMSGMFYRCSALTSLDVSNFKTQNVTYMNGMFRECWALTSLDVSKFNTQNVTDMSSMFRYCQALRSLDLSNFNTENVTGMNAMFRDCKALTWLNVSNFNTQNVTDMREMFYHCEALTSLYVSNFNTQKVTNMGAMFSGCTSLTTIFCNSNWDVDQNVNDGEMFYCCWHLKGTNTAFDANKTGIRMANPTTGYFTSLPVPTQEAYAVLTPDSTLSFYYDNQYYPRLIYGRIYDMPKPGERPAWAGDYYPQRSIKHVVFDNSFSGYRPTSTNSWFEFCFNLQDIKGIRNLNTENVNDMREMFYHCEALTSLDLSSFNTEKVTSMSEMFSDCKALTSLDVSNFNTENVTSMGYMFFACSALTSLDLSNFNTQNVTDMGWMFYGCSALTSLDLSNFNTPNVTEMGWMFYGCESLTIIFCNSNWHFGHNVYDGKMFYNCTQLKGTNTSYNANKIGIDMANPTTGYFTSKTTGIDHVKTADGASDGKIYDLSGSRVNESYKGIVIKNGKKYIQK